MKILKLDILNLASFEGEHSINFESEPLASADLFSIVGDTGSGKSTLLDAICLALYGLAPRFYGADKITHINEKSASYNKDQELDPTDSRNIMRRGSQACHAKVTFLANDHCTYRATWSCKFGRTNFGSAERTLVKLVFDEQGIGHEMNLSITGGKKSANGNKKVVNTALDEIIGLDYSQFTRTVMLAQNSFANFIKASDADKALLLEKLTGTEIYTAVAKQINTFFSEAREAFNAIDQQIKSLSGSLLSDEELLQKKTDLDNLDKELVRLRLRSDELKANQQWLTDAATLQQKLQTEKTAEVVAQNRLTALADDRAHLVLLDKVSPIHNDYNTLQQLSRELEQLSSTIKTEQKELANSENDLANAEKQLLSAKNAYTQAKGKAEKKAKPIQEARALMVSINEKNEALKTKQKACAENHANLKDLTTTIANYKVESQKLEVIIKEADSQLALIKEDAPMAESVPVIIERLKTLHTNINDIQNLESSIHNIQKNLPLQKAEADKSEQLCNVIAERLTKCKEALTPLIQTIQTQPIEQFQNAVAVAHQRVELLEKIQGAYAELLGRKSERKEVLKGIGQWSKQNDVLLEQIDKQKVVCENLLVQWNEAQKNYALLSSQSVESLREGLQDGEECPVCGSTHHPFSLQQGINSVLMPLKEHIESLSQQKTKADKLLNEASVGLRAQQSLCAGKLQAANDRKLQLDAEITNKHEALKSLLSAFSLLTKDWMSNDSLLLQVDALLDDTQSEDAGNTLLQPLMVRCTEAERVANKALTARNALQVKADELNRELEKLNIQYRSENNIYAAKHTACVKAETSLKEQLQQLAQIKAVSTPIKEELASIILWPKWSQQLMQNYNELVGRFNRLYTIYQSATKQKTDATNRLATLKAQTELKTQSLKDIQERCNRDDDSFKQAQEELKTLQKQLVGLLNGQNPDELEASLKAEVAKYEKLSADLEAVHKQKNEVTSRWKGSLERSQQQLQEKTTQQATIRGGIEAFMESSDVALNWPLLQTLFDVNAHWPERRKAVNDAVTEVKTRGEIVIRCMKDIELHEQAKEKPMVTAEALQLSMTEVMTDINNKDKLRQEVGGQLSAHNTNLAKVAGFMPERNAKEKQFFNWKQLNDVMGNADGSKFRESAQVYTLQFLVHQANAQLKLLNRRYSMEQVRNSLSIRVIDHDRADEVRNISSLSGGETFLISLALALGLSALSSRNISMQNLFVDEGFGTLDTESLNIVIDTLSSLQSMQGKKVGVISHTNEMRERIKTQIRVVKCGAGGKSKIEIERN